MRKLTTILAAFILFFSASAFSKNYDPVSATVKAEFEKDFSSATYVNWKETEGVYFATFKIQQQDFTAAYSDNGELLGVSRNISLNQLPLSVSLAIQNKYPEYKFNESIVELIHDGQTTYYFDAENAKYKLKLTSSSSGVFNVEKRTKKK